jgi:hypothetical protein
MDLKLIFRQVAEWIHLAKNRIQCRCVLANTTTKLRITNYITFGEISRPIEQLPASQKRLSPYKIEMVCMYVCMSV